MFSVVILAKDEKSIIAECINRLYGCNDICVVLDPGSSDGTRDLLRALPVRVFEHPFADFAAQRNWALEHISFHHPWVLMLDADELATPSFLDTLNEAITKAKPSIVAFAICRKTIFLGRWMKRSDSYPVWIMRVVRTEVRFESSGHGEVPIPIDSSTIEYLKQPLEHHAFYKGISQWIDRHNRYSSREADLEMNSVAEVRMLDIVSLQPGRRRKALRNLARSTVFRPVLRFLYQYVLRGGFLEGKQGFIYCLLLAGYETQILAKTMEKQLESRSGQQHA